MISVKNDIREARKLPRNHRRCPYCFNDTFEVMVHVTNVWKVDGAGNCMEVLEDAPDVTHGPMDDDKDLWTCYRCGFWDSTYVFNTNIE